MASRRRESLKPHLARIRIWIEEGRTDFWIAHELGTTPQALATFRRSHGVLRVPHEAPADEPPPDVVDEPVTEVEEAGSAEIDEAVAPPADGDEPAEATEDADAPARRRGRRGGRRRRATAEPVEVDGVLEHGEDGYGLWLDAAIADSEVYRRHWAERSALVVRVTADEIVLRPAGESPEA